MILIPLQAVLTVGASFIMLISQLLASAFMLQKSFYSAWTLIPVVLLGFYFSCMNTFYELVYTTLMKTKYPHDNHDSWLTGMRHRNNSRVDSCSGTLWRRSSQHIMQRGDLCNAHDKFKTPCVNRCELLHIGYFHCAVRRADDDYCDGGSYYWVYGVLIFLVLTGMHGMRCVPLLRLVVGKRNR